VSVKLGGQLNALAPRVKDRWQAARSKLTWRIKMTLTCKHNTPDAPATAAAKKGPKHDAAINGAAASSALKHYFERTCAARETLP
jgi:hypothetical protein